MLALTRGRLALALALGIACGLTRPQGFAFVLPLVVAAWRLPVPRRPFALAAAAGPVAGLALFAVYLHVHAGDALAYTHAQEGPFQARTSPGLHGLVVAVRLQYQRLIDGVRPWEVRDLAATVGYLGLLAVAAWRRLPWEWVALGAISLLLPLAAGSMAGTSRYALLALPVFWLLARAARWQLLVALSAAGFVANLLWLPTHWP